jgi:hypothetical protein
LSIALVAVRHAGPLYEKPGFLPECTRICGAPSISPRLLSAGDLTAAGQARKDDTLEQDTCRISEAAGGADRGLLGSGQLPGIDNQAAVVIRLAAEQGCGPGIESSRLVAVTEFSETGSIVPQHLPGSA